MYLALWESLFIIYLISFFCNILYAVKRSHLVKGKLHFNFVPAINVLALSSKSFHYLLCSNGLGSLSILPLQQVQCQLRCWKSYCKKESLLCYQRHCSNHTNSLHNLFASLDHWSPTTNHLIEIIWRWTLCTPDLVPCCQWVSFWHIDLSVPVSQPPSACNPEAIS